MTGPAEITRMIPHRHPILLVDRVDEIVPDERIVAVKAVTSTEPCYAGIGDGAAPEDFAYPPPLLVESWGQAAVLLAVWRRPNPDVLAGMVELATGARDIRFLAPVHPGDLLVHHARLVRAVGDTAVVAGETLRDGVPVMTVGQFIVTLRPAEVLRPAALV